MAHEIYWEDLHVGRSFEMGGRTLTAEEIIGFASQFDPQPFHLDAEAARRSVFGGLCASGWHTCALVMRMMVDGMLSRSASQGSPGIDNLRWIRPVYPGDTIRVRYTIVEARPLKSRPGVGLVRAGTDVFNQRDEHVMHMESHGMFLMREPHSTP